MKLATYCDLQFQNESFSKENPGRSQDVAFHIRANGRCQAVTLLIGLVQFWHKFFGLFYFLGHFVLTNLGACQAPVSRIEEFRAKKSAEHEEMNKKPEVQVPQPEVTSTQLDPGVTSDEKVLPN